jgi:type I restriction enzyme, R subunit
VLDFVNDTDSISDAFEDYYEATIAETTDPAELYVAHGNVTAFGVINEADEAAFAEVFLKEGDDPSAHARLLNHLHPAVARYDQLDDEDKKRFRIALGKFLDIYAFLAQAVAFTDAKLEATYLYSRHLQRALPSERSGSLDLGGDIVLTHLRIEAGQERDISPDHGGEVLGAETGEVPEPTDPETESLQHIIEDLNARFGSELSGKDRVLIEKVLDDMAEDGALRQKAKVNSRENFMLDFARLFQDEVMSTENTSRMFFDRFFADDEFRAALINAAGGEFHRRHGGDQQAA